MTSLGKFKKAIKKDWYIQGIPAYPICLNHAALSGMDMKKDLGFGYTRFLFKYENGYGEMWYLTADIKRLWGVLKKNIFADAAYLPKLRKRYLANVRKIEKRYRKLSPESLAEYGDKELCSLLRNCARDAVLSVGIAHLIEPISIELEKEFRQQLFRELSVEQRKSFNQLLIALSETSKPSFIMRESMDLLRIEKLPSREHARALRRHTDRYFWISNSYARNVCLSEDDFRKRLKEISILWIPDAGKKRKLIRQLGLSATVRKMVRLIDFVTLWQDQRKEYILRMTGYIHSIIDELQRRTGIDGNVLRNLSSGDMGKIWEIKDVQSMEQELKARLRGVYFLYEGTREYTATGRDFAKLNTLVSKKKARSASSREIRGSIAYPGSVIGRVIVCKSLESIADVREGDVLVASMTRPEFLPAIKKAAGIITDEGGITCHAAIISREFRIPTLIGTKNATDILTTGMIVEIRANHGLVRILG